MKRPHGTIRQSQVITTFGPGAMVDLPRHSVVIGGLDEWKGERRSISEPRLQAKLEKVLGAQGLQLFAPPTEPDDPAAPPTGITAWEFPEWFVAQHEERRGPARLRPLVHRRQLLGDRYETPSGRKVPAVPVRFVQGCVNGHLSDLDWYRFVHLESKTPDCRRPLWIEESGTSGDLADVHVRCDCGARRSLMQATRQGKETLGFCRGARPWLGARAHEECLGESGKAQPNRLLLRHASDAYFPQVLSVISIPEAGLALRLAVDKVWDDFLAYAEDVGDVARERRKAKVAAALEGHTDEQVWGEVQRRKGGPPPEGGKSIKQAEIETLLASADDIGTDAPDGADFRLSCTGRGSLSTAREWGTEATKSQ